MGQRIRILTTAPHGAVPFSHLHLLAGCIHKWLGQGNEVHGAPALHSFSWLTGGEGTRGGLRFPGGASLFFSAWDGGLARRLLQGIRDEPSIFCGMQVREVHLLPSRQWQGEGLFRARGGVLLKVPRADRTDDHVTFGQPRQAEEALTLTLQRKLALAGLPHQGAYARFAPEAMAPKTKLVSYKGIENRVSLCPVLVEGTPEQVEFAYYVGAGHSTGTGFGALEKVGSDSIHS